MSQQSSGSGGTCSVHGPRAFVDAARPLAFITCGSWRRRERIFSLINNIKTADRAKLGQQKLKNLMLWHELGKKLTPQEVPVVAILKEFREMAGPRGRTAHRPQEPSKYEYEKHRAPIKVED